MEDDLDPITPSDCALLVGLPLTRDDFMVGLSSDKDFAKHVKRSNLRHGVPDDHYWEDIYGPVAKVIRNVCERVGKLGVTVVDRATLPDLQELAVSGKVLTIVGHWRFMALAPDDVQDVSDLFISLRSPKGKLGEAISLAVSRRFPELLQAGELPAGGHERLLETLNSIIRSAHRWYQREDGREPPREPTEEDVQRLTRPALEQAFPCAIRPGRAIELSDGMHSIQEFAGVLPENFKGLLDLTICNSVILGAAIKRARPESTVAVIRYPAEVAVRMALYVLAIEELKRRRSSFIDALANIHRSRRF